MNLAEDIKPVTYLKANAAELLNHINTTHRPVVITQNGEPRAVLQDPESYESMRKALMLMKLISIGETEIKHSCFKSQKDVFDRIETSLKEIQE